MRQVTAITYTSTEWSKEQGGQLRLYPQEGGKVRLYPQEGGKVHGSGRSRR